MRKHLKQSENNKGNASAPVCGDKLYARMQPEFLPAPTQPNAPAPGEGRKQFALCRKGSCCPVLEVLEGSLGEVSLFIVEDGVEINYSPEEFSSLLQEIDKSPCDYFYLSAGSSESASGVTLSREHIDAAKEIAISYLQPEGKSAD